MKRRIFLNDSYQKEWDRNNFLIVPFLSTKMIHELIVGYDNLDEISPDPFHLSLWTRNYEQRNKVNDLIASVFCAQVQKLLVNYKPLIHSFATKRPGLNSNWHIHQDDTFTDESNFESLSIWVPFVDTDMTNGTISIVKNSHRFFHGPRCSTIEKPFRNLFPMIEKDYLQPIPVKAGEALIFGHKLIHASGPNMTSQTRNAAVGVYLPAEAPVFYYFKDSDDRDGSVSELLLPDDYYLRFPLGEKPVDPGIVCLRKIFPENKPWSLIEWKKVFSPISKSQKFLRFFFRK